MLAGGSVHLRLRLTTVERLGGERVNACLSQPLQYLFCVLSVKNLHPCIFRDLWFLDNGFAKWKVSRCVTYTRCGVVRSSASVYHTLRPSQQPAIARVSTAVASYLFGTIPGILMNSWEVLSFLSQDIIDDDGWVSERWLLVMWYIN